MTLGVRRSPERRVFRLGFQSTAGVRNAYDTVIDDYIITRYVIVKYKKFSYNSKIYMYFNILTHKSMWSSDMILS